MATLYLCRHAIAEDPQGDMKDEDRALTPEGIQKFRKSAHGLIKLAGPGEISHIFSSPLVRARQTAEILAQVLAEEGGKTAVQITPTLGPGGQLKAFLKLLQNLNHSAAIAAVGHEPIIGMWVGELCFGKPGDVLIKKGAVAAIELARDNLHGELQWLMQPGMLREV